MIYTLESILVKGIHIVSTPIFTRLMSVEQIGCVTNYQTWSAFFADISTIGLSSGAINVALANYKNERKEYIKSVLTLVLFNIIFWGGVCCFLYPWLKNIIKMPLNYLYIIYITTFFSTGMHLWMSFNRYEYRYKTVFTITIISSGLMTIVSALGVYYYSYHKFVDLPTIKIILSSLISLLFTVPICIYNFSQKGRFIDFDKWKFALLIGIPMIVNMFAKSILSMSDKVMINKMCGKFELGLYGTLYIVSSLATIVWSSINSSFIPYLYENIESVDKSQNIKNIANEILLLFASASILIMLFAPEIIRIIATKDYLQAIYVTPPVAAGIFFTAFYTLYGNVILYHKKSKYLMYCTSFAAIFNLCSNYIFIKIFGYVGAAYTTLVSYAFMAFIYYIISKKIHNNQVFDDKYLWIIGCFVMIFVFICNLLYKLLLLRYFICILFVILTIYLAYITYNKILMMKQSSKV